MQPQVIAEENMGDCPRCKIRLSGLQIGEIGLRECERCDGVWADAGTFENICADRENNAAVLGWAQEKQHITGEKVSIQYVPCPNCKQLMNRNNFARSSGVIIDICKEHGVWFDVEELPRIVEFIHAGGLNRARQREKAHLEEERRNLREEQYKLSRQQSNYGADPTPWNDNTGIGIRDFVRLLFD